MALLAFLRYETLNIYPFVSIIYIESEVYQNLPTKLVRNRSDIELTISFNPGYGVFRVRPHGLGKKLSEIVSTNTLYGLVPMELRYLAISLEN